MKKLIFIFLLVILSVQVTSASEIDPFQIPGGDSQELEIFEEDQFLEQRQEVELLSPPENSQENQSDENLEIVYMRARIENVTTTKTEVLDEEVVSQIVTVRILTGDRKGETVVINNGGGVLENQARIYQEGDLLVVAENLFDGQGDLYIHDIYRLTGVAWMVSIFLILTIFFARWQGIGGLTGLIVSVGILFAFIIPQLIAGANPTLVTLLGTVMIVSVTIFISHGFRRRSFIALISTIITLFLAYGLSVFFVNITKMFGTGSEEIFFLQFAVQSASEVTLDVRGLLLGGILIGMLGVLDDVTVGQAAAMDEIHLANPKMKFQRLYKAGMSVGRDHIASMVNSLALAYVGASLPLFLLLYVNTFGIPLWVTLNSEFIAQEIVRTIAGSSAILLAVPITALIAAYWYTKDKSETNNLKKIFPFRR